MELREDLGPLRHRSAVLLVLVLVCLSAIFLRLVHLQLLNASYWRRMAENNRLRRLPVPASRGRIYDRTGQVLADNVAVWDLLIFPDEAKDLDESVLFLARTGIAKARTLHERLRSHGTPLAPLLIGENLDWNQVARIRCHLSDHPELSVTAGLRRQYPFDAVAGHAVGYLRPISKAEIAAQTHKVRPDAMVGATGVEALRNSLLAGRSGERWLVTNAVGQQMGVVREQSARLGQDLSMTLDIRLQQVAVAALKDQAGAVVAMDPESGAVRVLYSAPGFDPNLFGRRLSAEQWQGLRDDPMHRLQNRCFHGVYPPASTLKPFLALGGLSEGVITPQWRAYCRGTIELHGHEFHCWLRGGHGSVRLQRSLEVSCDTYYYLLGQRLGIDRIARWYRKFGLGERTGIGLAGEHRGLVGTPEWSSQRNQPWYRGITVSVSIGQGPLETTVLQIARAYAALANGGWLVTPYLVEESVPHPRLDLKLDPDHLGEVLSGLNRVVHGSQGTAYRLADLPISGKTGTAQVTALVEGVSQAELPPHLRHHAWFVGWAPSEAPELVVAVVVEHGGGGAAAAAPVAARVLRAALEKE